MSIDKTQVVVLTKHYRVEGEIDLIPGARMTDFMNKLDKFMVVTKARVVDFSGKEVAGRRIHQCSCRQHRSYPSC